jgi:uncharacterized protein (DUF2141 family)
VDRSHPIANERVRNADPPICKPPLRDTWPCRATLVALLLLFAAGCTKPRAAAVPADSAGATATAQAAGAVAAKPSLPATSPATRQSLAHLTVRVTGLRNHNGQLIFGVFTSANGFPNVERKSVNWQVKDPDADSVTFEADLPPGVYGASVLHDENRNNQMDRNVAGIPEEGYGVTNNPRPALRAARFDEATFTLPPEGKVMTISVQYFQ